MTFQEPLRLVGEARRAQPPGLPPVWAGSGEGEEEEEEEEEEALMMAGTLSLANMRCVCVCVRVRACVCYCIRIEKIFRTWSMIAFPVWSWLQRKDSPCHHFHTGLAVLHQHVHVVHDIRPSHDLLQ